MKRNTILTVFFLIAVNLLTASSLYIKGDEGIYVLIDGLFKGKTCESEEGLKIENMKAGEYSLRLFKEEFSELNEKFSIEPNDTLIVNVKLDYNRMQILCDKEGEIENIQPEKSVKPKVNIVIEDDLSMEEEEDIEIIETIDKTVLDPFGEIVGETSSGTTPKGFIYRDEEPTLIKKAKLVHPPAMRRAGIEGTVVLELEILKSGKVGAIDVIESVLPGKGGLDEAAIDYARQLEFEPAKANGEPVAVWVRFPVTFTL